MKRISLFLSIILIICMVGCGDVPTIEATYDDESSYASVSSEVSSETSVSSAVLSEAPASSESPVSSVQTGTTDNSWKMVLINGSHPLEEGFMPELSQINTKYAAEGARFDSRAIADLHRMCDAAYEDGVWLWVASAWRSNARQTNNFNRETDEAMSLNPGISREEAEKIAATVVARPWTSEHQLGLAIDFNSVEESFKNTKQYAWLQEHAHEYGFIMRYAAEKQELTGVIYEPWHYRYVGVENAAAIKNSGLCLEEYLESAY